MQPSRRSPMGRKELTELIREQMEAKHSEKFGMSYIKEAMEDILESILREAEKAPVLINGFGVFYLHSQKERNSGRNFWENGFATIPERTFIKLKFSRKLRKRFQDPYCLQAYSRRGTFSCASLIKSIRFLNKELAKDYADILHFLFQGIYDFLDMGYQVHFRRFGNFWIYRKVEHKGADPRNGTPLDLPAIRIPKFKITAMNIKDTINQ